MATGDHDGTSTYEVLGGWVPYRDRTEAQQQHTDSWREATPRFCDVNAGIGELPKTALNFQLHLMLGGRPPRVYQQTGSCVGAGGAVAYADSMAGDIVYRGDQERVELPFPYATWGVGRFMGNMGGPGEGSFGSIQGEAVEKWGMLPMDAQGVPTHTQQEDWFWWTKNQEYSWSWPTKWPVDKATLDPVAAKYRIHKQVQAHTIEEMMQAAAQGYGITIASNYGSNTMRVKDGFLIATWDTSWAHQMCLDGYHTHPTLGRLWLDKNQWWKKAHPLCPYLQQFKIDGAFWIPEADILRNLKYRDTEVIIHSNTMGFEPRNLAAARLGIAA